MRPTYTLGKSNTHTSMPHQCKQPATAHILYTIYRIGTRFWRVKAMAWSRFYNNLEHTMKKNKIKRRYHPVLKSSKPHPHIKYRRRSRRLKTFCAHKGLIPFKLVENPWVWASHLCQGNPPLPTGWGEGWRRIKMLIKQPDYYTGVPRTGRREKATAATSKCAVLSRSTMPRTSPSGCRNSSLSHVSSV